MLAEWFKAAVLKTAKGEALRDFESHPRRSGDSPMADRPTRVTHRIRAPRPAVYRAFLDARMSCSGDPFPRAAAPDATRAFTRVLFLLSTGSAHLVALLHAAHHRFVAGHEALHPLQVGLDPCQESLA